MTTELEIRQGMRYCRFESHQTPLNFVTKTSWQSCSQKHNVIGVLEKNKG